VAATTSTSSYRFGRFELQPSERRLLSAGTPVAVGPRALDLLVALVERGGSLLTKDELLDRVWPGVIVEDNALQAQVSALRKIVGPEAIATVSRSGYRFTLELRSVAAETANAQGTPPLASTPKHNLPQSLTSFIGREKEIAELVQLLGPTRLLTLTGSGGCGKTRLALRVAANLLQNYPDGVWLAELAALADPGLVPQAVAGALGLKEQSGKSLTLTIGEYLAAKRVLLVLDNAEHLLEACAVLVDEVLHRCGRTTIVVTSRERLGLQGELTYRVPSLAVPDPMRDTTPEELAGCASARLFIERARLQQPRFVVTTRNARALASLCWRLDGIPLAIELAAPRVRSMTVEEVNRRLDQRFGLLTGGSRTALPRQRTLRSLIDWSYDLLNAAEQALLCRVSVFSGGWTLEAMEVVCSGDRIERSDMLHLLISLIDKSLALAEEHDAATRYRLLETVRQYARDRLSEQQQPAHWRDKHLAYFLAMAEEAEEGIRGAEQTAWLRRLETEHDNLREALAWSTTPCADVALGLRMAGALFPFWNRNAHFSEGRGWFARMLADRPDEQSRASRAKALNGAGFLATLQGHFDAAYAFLEEALAIRRQLDDRRGIAVALNNLAMLLTHRDEQEHSRARILHEESLAIRRELGDQWGIAISLDALANNAVTRGDHTQVRVLSEETLAIRRRLNDHWGIANALATLAEAAIMRNDHAAAFEALTESLAISATLPERDQMSLGLHLLACVALACALPYRSARLLGAAEQLRSAPGSGRQQTWPHHYLRQVAAARAAFANDPSFDAALQEGGTMTLEEALRYALDPDVRWPPGSNSL
jgi:predicted ATPase/DNA-binding winged helix-turn-helix (wHTH) protein